LNKNVSRHPFFPSNKKKISKLLSFRSSKKIQKKVFATILATGTRQATENEIKKNRKAFSSAIHSKRRKTKKQKEGAHNILFIQ
jgi:hypothetical protein